MRHYIKCDLVKRAGTCVNSVVCNLNEWAHLLICSLVASSGSLWLVFLPTNIFHLRPVLITILKNSMVQLSYTRHHYISGYATKARDKEVRRKYLRHTCSVKVRNLRMVYLSHPDGGFAFGEGILVPPMPGWKKTGPGLEAAGPAAPGAALKSLRVKGQGLDKCSGDACSFMWLNVHCSSLLRDKCLIMIPGLFGLVFRLQGAGSVHVTNKVCMCVFMCIAMVR